jgi:hypothetical protein
MGLRASMKMLLPLTTVDDSAPVVSPIVELPENSHICLVTRTANEVGTSVVSMSFDALGADGSVIFAGFHGIANVQGIVKSVFRHFGPMQLSTRHGGFDADMRVWRCLLPPRFRIVLATAVADTSMDFELRYKVWPLGR